MSNLETVQAIYQAFGRGDVPTIVEFVHPDVEWEHDIVTEGIPWVTPRRGKAGVLEFFGSLADVDIQRFEPVSFLTNDHQVFATIRLEATVRSTGRKVTDLEGHLFTFDAQGRVVRLRHFIDTHQHLTAARA